jgi:hypothetical protein
LRTVDPQARGVEYQHGGIDPDHFPVALVEQILHQQEACMIGNRTLPGTAAVAKPLGRAGEQACGTNL